MNSNFICSARIDFAKSFIEERAPARERLRARAPTAIVNRRRNTALRPHRACVYWSKRIPFNDACVNQPHAFLRAKVRVKTIASFRTVSRA